MQIQVTGLKVTLLMIVTTLIRAGHVNNTMAQSENPRIRLTAFSCMSIGQFFFRDRYKIADSWDVVLPLASADRLTRTDIDEQRVGAIVILAAAKDKRVLPVIRKLIRDVPAKSLDGVCPVMVWCLMWIQDVDSSKELVELILKEGFSPYALSALERLTFRSTKSVRTDRNACHKEWQAILNKEPLPSWNKAIECALRKKGVELKYTESGQLSVECLLRAWEKCPLPQCCLEYPNLKTPVDEDLLLSMRLSELLCLRTGSLEISPAAFIYGVPDRQWDSAYWRTDKDAWRKYVDEQTPAR